MPIGSFGAMGLNLAFLSGDILPLCGTREGLVSALTIAVALKGKSHAAVLMPNPFYQAYYAAALTAGCEPVLLSRTAATGFLPDLDALDSQAPGSHGCVLSRLARQSAGSGCLRRLSRTADRRSRESTASMSSPTNVIPRFTRDDPPPGALEIAARSGSFDRVLVFNSLSKRSNSPGLRSGFIAGDGAFLKDYLQYRNVASPQVPVPIQHASAALWADEEHVARSRALYREKVALASRKLGALRGYYEPAGGFFLWLDLSNFGGGERAAETIWKGCGVKILPGAYLAQPDASGVNPAKDYARLALVDPLDVTREALDRLASFLL